MRPLTFILILTLTTAAIILVCSFVDKKYGSTSYSSSSSPNAESFTSHHGAEKYSKSGQQKSHPMKVKAEKKHEAGKKFLSLAEGKVPSFQDVFDEETFYIFAGCVALGSVLLAFIGSRFLTLSDPDDPDEILKRVRRWKIKHTQHGHPTMDDDNVNAAATAAAGNDSSSNAAAAAAEESKAKDAKERAFLDYTDDDDDDDDYDSEGDDSEEERELLRRVEEKFFRDRRQPNNVEATMG